MINSILSSLLIISAIILCNIALYAYRRKHLPGALVFSGLMIATVFYSVGYALELLSTSVEEMFFWIKLEYVGISFYPFLLATFIREYTDEKRVATKSVLTFLFSINITTLILVITNSYHGLFYSSLSIDKTARYIALEFSKGFWYYVDFTTLSLVAIYTVVVLGIKIKNSKGELRKKLVLMFTGTLIPLLTNLIYILGLGPKNIDLAPFSFFFMIILFFLTFFQTDFLSFKPITHQVIFNSIEEAVIVVDKANLLVGFNNSSRQFFPSLQNIKIGESIESVTELKDCNLELNNIIYNVDKRIFNIKRIQASNHNGSIFVIKDITDSENTKKQLQILATMDGLTGLFNRRYFMEWLSSTKKPGAFVMFDIDYFKTINDTYGHSKGDKVLMFFGKLLKTSFPDNVICRYGGEEFALFMENTNIEKAYSIVEEFRKNLEIPDDIPKFTFSAGLAKFKINNISKTINKADSKLYEAKNNGRNQVSM